MPKYEEIRLDQGRFLLFFQKGITMSSSNATFTPLNLKEGMETIRAKVAEMMPKQTSQTNIKADVPKVKVDDIWSRIED